MNFAELSPAERLIAEQAVLNRRTLNNACDMAKATTSPMPVTALVTELYRMLGANGDANKGQIGLMYLYKQEAL